MCIIHMTRQLSYLVLSTDLRLHIFPQYHNHNHTEAQDSHIHPNTGEHSNLQRSTTPYRSTNLKGVRLAFRSNSVQSRESIAYTPDVITVLDCHTKSSVPSLWHLLAQQTDRRRSRDTKAKRNEEPRHKK